MVSYGAHAELELPFGSLTIYAEDKRILDVRVLDSYVYPTLIANHSYTITLAPGIHPCRIYRQEMFSKGLYLGHHLGPPGSVSLSHNHLSVSLNNGTPDQYRYVLWCYAIKIFLTTNSLSFNALHIKATVVINKRGQAILLIGRGGSGKTTLAKFLSKNGLVVLSNTHAIVSYGNVWGINTWTRVRDCGHTYFLAPRDAMTLGVAPIASVFIVNFNTESKLLIESLDLNKAMVYLEQFSLATTNYELKEDLMDYFGDALVFCRYLAKEREELFAFVQKFQIRYLSVDVLSDVTHGPLLSLISDE
jgi:hypothetical protein